MCIKQDSITFVQNKIIFMRKTVILLTLTLFTLNLLSQIPTGYYNGTNGLSGNALKIALHNIIDNHNSVSYTSLWSHVQNTDKKPNNKVWDMYSDVPGGTPPYEFTFSTNQCGNYSQEGDCYNREHSWPQSWFNSGSPMKTDLFHVYPTDGYVNGQRGSYPFGNVTGTKWTSLNGSKKGDCSYPGYNGTAFEPIDEYKGDFARSYFYMSTRYYGEDSGWQNNSMVNGAEILPWAQNLLMEWSINDPVSTKEINRNNEVYNIQNNRNPYIDHPEFALLIFSSNYPQPTYLSTPVITGTEAILYEYTITASDSYNNNLSFLAANIPTWLTLTDLGNNTALLYGTPATNDTGINLIGISVTNNYSTAVEQIFEIDINAITRINTFANTDTDIFIYPNPTNDKLFIKNIKGNYQVSIITLTGITVKSHKINFTGSQTTLPLADINSGIYLIKFTDKSSNSFTTRLVKY